MGYAWGKTLLIPMNHTRLPFEDPTHCLLTESPEFPLKFIQARPVAVPVV